MSERTVLKSCAMCLGAASMGVQIILLRQFMTVFYGNELIVGIVLALWLLWVGAGSYVGHFWWKTKKPKQSLFSLLLVASLFASVCVYVATKFVRFFFHVPYGEFLSYSDIFLFAGFALYLPAFLYGFLFSLLARLAQNLSSKSGAAAFIYAYEAIGTVLVGFCFTFMLLKFSNLTCLFSLTFFLSLVLFFLTRIKKLLVSLLFALLVLFLIPPVSHKIESYLLQKYWTSVDETILLRDWQFTRFGESSIIEWGGERFLYHNGLKVAALQNTIENQSLAATILSQHPRPQKILLVEGNAGGLAIECANFNIRVDLMEMDGEMFQFARAHMDAGSKDAWNAENIQIKMADARRSLAKTDSVWDMIIVNAGPPATVLSNRYYTTSFFRLAKERLAENGILTICHFPAGENFLGDELLSLNAILWNTLKSQFTDVLALPGENALFFAANSPHTLVTSIPELQRRYNEQHISQDYFAPQMFEYIYQHDRLEKFAELLQTSTQQRLNKDFHPVSYIFDFLLWHKIVRGPDKMMRSLFSLRFPTIFVFTSVFLTMLIFALLSSAGRWVFKWRIRLSAAIVGFFGMTFSIILLLILQTFFGYIYAWIGVAMAAYMAGLAGASLLVNEHVILFEQRKLLLWLFLITILFLLLLLPMLALFSRLDSPLIYIILFFVSGALVGAVFPLLCRTYTRLTSQLELGSIYAADVLGGACGAFFISSFFIPLYGFFNTLLLTAVLCLAGFILLIKNESTTS